MVVMYQCIVLLVLQPEMKHSFDVFNGTFVSGSAKKKQNKNKHRNEDRYCLFTHVVKMVANIH